MMSLILHSSAFRNSKIMDFVYVVRHIIASIRIRLHNITDSLSIRRIY